VIKEKIKKRYGTLRFAAQETGINYYRLSQIVNGWIIPKPAELRLLSLTQRDLKRKEAKCHATQD
jgi:hypothetical protein